MVQDKRKAQLKTTKKGTQQPSATQKSVGKSKAAKQALADKRRGLRNNAKPTQMEVDSQVGKQKKKDDRAKKGAQLQKKKQTLNKEQMKTFRETERKATTLMKIAEQAVEKAKEGKPGGNTAAKNKPPTRKAIDAAVAALQLAGYTPPEGMKMVIKLEESNLGGGRSGNERGRNQNQSKTGKQNRAGQSGNTPPGRNDNYRQARQGERNAQFRGGRGRGKGRDR